MATLEKVAHDIPWRVPGKDPLVLLTGFGLSSIDFEVSVWCDDPWTARVALSDLQLAIWFAFVEAEIVIAYPQMDVHLAPAIEARAADALAPRRDRAES